MSVFVTLLTHTFSIFGFPKFRNGETVDIRIPDS